MVKRYDFRKLDFIEVTILPQRKGFLARGKYEGHYRTYNFLIEPGKVVGESNGAWFELTEETASLIRRKANAVRARATAGYSRSPP